MKRTVCIHVLGATLLACGLVSGCQDSPGDSGAAPASTDAPMESAEDTMPAAETRDTEAAAPTVFSVESVPVSRTPLGDFPFFSLPTGYEPLNKPEQRDFDRFPFWVGDRFEWVEGKVWSTYIDTVKGKTMSEHEVRRNFEHVITQAGGVKVFEGQVPRSAVATLGKDLMVERGTGIGGIGSEPSSIWLLRTPDSDVWVYLNTNSAGGSLTIAQAEAFNATARLLPAGELQQQLDAAGKVAIEVNFDVDKAEILPDSKPQIDQVAGLLEQQPSLRLSVNGHTDDTGTPARNKALSHARAKAVVAALVTHGIAASRLEAQGLGATAPVADNATEEGRARNRRVELVKLD